MEVGFKYLLKKKQYNLHTCCRQNVLMHDLVHLDFHLPLTEITAVLLTTD